MSGTDVKRVIRVGLHHAWRDVIFVVVDRNWTGAAELCWRLEFTIEALNESIIIASHWGSERSVELFDKVLEMQPASPRILFLWFRQD